MARDNPPICQTCGIAHTIKHIFVDCFKYGQDRVIHKIPYNPNAAFGPSHQQNIEATNFLK